MNKHTKITAIVLAVVMMLAMLISASGLEIFIIASSDEYKDYTTSAEYLETISVLKGYDDGQLHLEEPILRYQAALFVARIVTGVANAKDLVSLAQGSRVLPAIKQQLARFDSLLLKRLWEDLDDLSAL